MRAVGGAPIQELAGLLARAYLRLLAARLQGSKIAQDPAAQESPTASPIPLDSAAPAKRQLDRRLGP